MTDAPVSVDLRTFGDKLSAWLRLGPLHEEIEATAHDLIVRHGVWAYDEAIHLSEVARFIGSPKNDKLYRLAAHEIKISFETAWGSLRAKRTDQAAPSRIAAK
jgi:hypothetical protein